MNNTFDIAIIGGGHAGVEAANIASQFSNLSIAIYTLPDVGLASAPCNPAIGGVGKGQVVRELDALGGIMPKLADLAGIQFRTLNDSKGYAVQSTRIQIDKDKYSELAEELMGNIKNISIIRQKVSGLVENNNQFEIKTNESNYFAKKIIVTVGTFLNGKLHVGKEQTSGGRIGSDASNSLSEFFKNIKTLSARFKTGTPARLNKDSIDYDVLQEQPSDKEVRNFHCLHSYSERFMPQVSCYLARTNSKTMKIIRDNKEHSPMYNGQINAVGARYCPSIEDKANRYPDKDIHHVFVEPEGIDSNTVYPSGISSSLPKKVQEEFINSIDGLTKAKIEVYGYAVEYDVVDTTCLDYSLEHQSKEGLYFAGQVNGTSGYEEAAAQGFIAGVNAALAILGRKSFRLPRDISYIGVMVEDLISNTRDEPYRLFTARNENRLYVREDNAVLRMCPYRSNLGLNYPIDKYNSDFISLYESLNEVIDKYFLNPGDEFLKFINLVIPRRMSMSEVLKIATIDPTVVIDKFLAFNNLIVPRETSRCLAISKKYDGYIQKADNQYKKVKKLDQLVISWQDIMNSENVSFECKQRIGKIKPTTFGQLKIIEGIRPATLAFVASRSV